MRTHCKSISSRVRQKPRAKQRAMKNLEITICGIEEVQREALKRASLVIN
jgi:hypothetical protein